MSHNYLLAGPVDIGDLEGPGPLGKVDIGTGSLTMFGKIISNIVGVMTIVAFIWFVIILILGAISWLGSGGDKTKLQEAQKQITTGLTGLLIVISSFFIVKLLEIIFGINILGIFDLLQSVKI